MDGILFIHAFLSSDPRNSAFRDLEWEEKILKLTQQMGIGAQFGGKYFCHDVRVVRLPRHGASCPIGLGVSCSADRQALGKITPEVPLPPLPIPGARTNVFVFLF